MAERTGPSEECLGLRLSQLHKDWLRFFGFLLCGAAVLFGILYVIIAPFAGSTLPKQTNQTIAVKNSKLIAYKEDPQKNITINAVNANKTFPELATVEKFSESDKLLIDSVKSVRDQLETIIVDCPVNSKNFSRGHYFEEFLDVLSNVSTLAAENGHPPMKVWFHLGRFMSSEEKNKTFCTELAKIGNRLYPEIFKGVVEDEKELYVSALARWMKTRKWADVDNERITTLEPLAFRLDEYPEQINKFHEQGFKVGFMIQPYNCFQIPTLFPENILSRFDELFFRFEERSKHKFWILNWNYLTIKDNILFPVTSNNYEECKEFIAKNVPGAREVKNIMSEGQLSYEVFVAAFSD